MLGVDYFFGDPVHIHTEDGFNREAWMAKSKKQAQDAFPGWLKAVKETYGFPLPSTSVGIWADTGIFFRERRVLLRRRQAFIFLTLIALL